VAKGAAACIAFVGIDLPGCCMDWFVLDFERHMGSLSVKRKEIQK
jgi:hypothetical protein